ncbi:unnamed protein product [Acanthoscelides obtectus]|uniref:Uncharacterized protein n=1 Tax=Acanthoscelides obtectus TaxID=200917 RepID=A0A9P0KSA4_ACAOB|nr:unnamed protein product [Acanthoscelides obtectus]CAK1655910.1 hypothetical protein AOBTE_LOCUS19433 [Acanthoscelides obtectus]
MCKITILGRGSMRDKAKEEEMRQSLDPKFAHLSEALHVEVSTISPPAEAHARIAYALAELRKFLVPDEESMMMPPQRMGPPQFRPGGPPNRGLPPPHPLGFPGGPRGAAGKTSVMSILDRARMAMENSYGGDGMGDEYMEDEYEEYPPAVPPRGGPGVGARRPAPITPKGYDEYDEDYYAPPPKRALKAPVTAASGRFGVAPKTHRVGRTCQTI